MSKRHGTSRQTGPNHTRGKTNPPGGGTAQDGLVHVQQDPPLRGAKVRSVDAPRWPRLHVRFWGVVPGACDRRVPAILASIIKGEYLLGYDQAL